MVAKGGCDLSVRTWPSSAHGQGVRSYSTFSWRRQRSINASGVVLSRLTRTCAAGAALSHSSSFRVSSIPQRSVHFCTSHWGTKWDVEAHEVEIDDDGLGFSGGFDSAWAPPMGVVEELVNQGFQVTLYYYEPGMGFVGKFEDGCDDYYEYSGENSKTVRAAIGDELDDMFGISESMEEYERENEEELTAWVKDGVEKRSELKTV